MAISSVTQATSKSTGVTLNKTVGKITMNGAALTAGSEVSFTVTNSKVAADDVVVANHSSAGTGGSYIVQVNTVAAGSFKITVSNCSAGDLSEAIVLQYRVLRSLA